MFSLSLLSPAQQEKGTPNQGFRLNREIEMTGRRLFQSPSQFKMQTNQGGMSMLAKGGSKLYASKLEDILEEDALTNMENHSHMDAYPQQSFHHPRLNNLDIMVNDDDMK